MTPSTLRRIATLSVLIAAALLSPGTALADIDFATWNLKHLGRKSLDTARAAKAVAGVELLVVQEVNTSKGGAEALAELASHLGSLAGARYCHGLSEIPTDAKERYGYIWREDAVAYVTTKGEVLGTCPRFSITLRLGERAAEKVVREPAVGVFQDKDSGKKILIATIHLVPTAKRPEREVAHAFDAVAAVAGRLPAVLAGDFNLDADQRDMATGASSHGFEAALPGGVKTSLKRDSRAMSKAYDNIYAKGARVTGTKVIDLHALNPDRSAREVFNELSDHAPIRAMIAVQ